MQTKCPNCGAVHSLDSLIAHDDAREALSAVIALGDELTKLTVRYCGLFRPAKTQLSFSRLATLLNELHDDMQRQRIMRDGNVYDAPPEAWIYAMQTMLNKRDTLTLPLKSHGYLYEIIGSYKPDHGVVDDVPHSNAGKSPTQTGSLAAYLQGKKR